MAGGVVDFTEPDPLRLERGIENPDDEPFLWRVELYLISKYQPEFVEATIFKVRQAALERAKIVKEHHMVHQSVQSLENAITTDLMMNVKWSQQRSHRASGGRAPTPGIGNNYQRELENL
jgi:hypothetical protein